MRLFTLFERKLPPDCILVPRVRQVEEFSCGAAATLGVLRYFEIDSDCSERDLFEPLGTDSDGTAVQDIVKLFKDYGLDAKFKSGVTIKELKNWVSPSQLALVCIQAWEREDDPIPLENSMNDGHYVVFVGSDEKFLYFMDPAMSGGKFGFIPEDDFVKRWHDWGKNGKRLDRQAIFVSGKEPKEKGKKADAKEIK